MLLYNYIKEKFVGGEYVGLSGKQIFADLGSSSAYEKKSVEKILRDLEKNGDIVFIGGKYFTVDSAGLIKGTLCGNERGFAFLIADDKNIPDCFIPNKSLHGALHKDVVLAKRVDGSRGDSDEAEVVKILSRGITSLCGTYYTERNFGFIRPDDKNYFDDIYISFKNSHGAKSGDKVFADLVKFSENENPEGVIKEILGRKYDLFAEENSIIIGSGYKEYFPDGVMKEVEHIPDEVQENQLIGRLNLTDKLIITIDGDDSRDFDDAVNVEKTSDGNYVLGVHIADVSEYVPFGSKIDKEALSRATSVYFPDRVIPMLPEKLSNGICSLSEGVTRLTLSCIMEIDGRGEIIDRKIVRSYIRSAHRMTYKNVQAMLDGDAKLKEKYADVFPMIENMEELREILSARREKRGSVNLEVREADITLNGKDIDVSPRTSLKAYNIIEEFMVLANECVAEFAFYSDVPFIYRVHEKPNEEKAQSFAEFLKMLGVNVRWRPESCRPSDFSALLGKFEGSPVYPLVNKVMLRSMQKAKYSTENIGHFGLSSKCYCHFTSPIRRYPDLVVHRVIKMILNGRIGEINDLYGDFVSTAALISSENERRADEVEREVDDLYKVKFMEKHVGEEFDAVISGVTPSGVFSELGNTVEGFTRLEDLPRGRYTFDERNFSLSSAKYSYKLGDKVRIGVLGADIAARRVEFIILKIYSSNSTTAD